MKDSSDTCKGNAGEPRQAPGDGDKTLRPRERAA